MTVFDDTKDGIAGSIDLAPLHASDIVTTLKLCCQAGTVQKRVTIIVTSLLQKMIIVQIAFR